MEYKMVEIRTNKLRSNLILAKDVIIRGGTVLASKDTMLNTRIINRLKEYNVKSVFVKVVDYGANNYQAANEVILQRSLPVEERKEFSVFQTLCGLKEEELKKYIINISNGDSIDTQQLYNFTDDIMGSLNLKSDIFTYLNFLKLKDDHTFSHSLNVSLLCNLFGRWMGITYDELVILTVAGMLHDIGKTQIDIEILNKPGKLTDDEYIKMQMHTVYGYDLLNSQEISNEIKEAALMHHEKQDGSGYPLRIKGDEIPSTAKIVAICDIYDAMTSDRVYRNKLCPFDVIKTFQQNLYGQLDTKFLLMFLNNIAYTYMSCNVILSNGQAGEIVFINPNNLWGPIVQVGEEFIDLSKRTDIFIMQLK